MNQEEIQTGEEPTDEEKFYVDWARETLKNSVTRINDLQKTMMTISISMLGGSLAFYGIINLPDVLKIVSILSLLLSVIVNAISTFHGQGFITTNVPYKIKEEKEREYSRKYFMYRLSFFSLLVPLILVLFGIMMKVF